MKKKFNLYIKKNFHLVLDLTFLNNIKKENKDKRKEQNKRYRKKYKELLNFKKTTFLSSREFSKKNST